MACRLSEVSQPPCILHVPIVNTHARTHTLGGFVVGDGITRAKILGKSEGVLCGSPFVNAIVELVGCSIEWLRAEGDYISAV